MIFCNGEKCSIVFGLCEVYYVVIPQLDIYQMLSASRMMQSITSGDVEKLNEIFNL